MGGCGIQTAGLTDAQAKMLQRFGPARRVSENITNEDFLKMFSITVKENEASVDFESSLTNDTCNTNGEGMEKQNLTWNSQNSKSADFKPCDKNKCDAKSSCNQANNKSIIEDSGSRSERDVTPADISTSGFNSPELIDHSNKCTNKPSDPYLYTSKDEVNEDTIGFFIAKFIKR